jgi:hypothetical protein
MDTDRPRAARGGRKEARQQRRSICLTASSPPLPASWASLIDATVDMPHRPHSNEISSLELDAAASGLRKEATQVVATVGWKKGARA